MRRGEVVGLGEGRARAHRGGLLARRAVDRAADQTDEKLVNAVPTLSHLNGAPGKDDIHVLDFRNTPEEIRKAFEPSTRAPRASCPTPTSASTRAGRAVQGIGGAAVGLGDAGELVAGGVEVGQGGAGAFPVALGRVRAKDIWLPATRTVDRRHGARAQLCRSQTLELRRDHAEGPNQPAGVIDVDGRADAARVHVAVGEHGVGVGLVAQQPKDVGGVQLGSVG